MSYIEDEIRIKNQALFWAEIERELGESVPIYLKNILMYQSLDNFLNMSHLTTNDFIDLEEFVKSKAYDIFSRNAYMRSSYYGLVYEHCPKEFKFSVGDKHMLLEIARIAKKIRNLRLKSEESTTLSAIEAPKPES